MYQDLKRYVAAKRFNIVVIFLYNNVGCASNVITPTFIQQKMLVKHHLTWAAKRSNIVKPIQQMLHNNNDGTFGRSFTH